MPDALGILETTGYTPAIAALDAMEKVSGVTLLQVEKNDFYGVILKVTGDLAAVDVALRTGKEVAAEMQGKPLANLMKRPDDRAFPAIMAKPEVSPLIQQSTVIVPASAEEMKQRKTNSRASGAATMADTQSFALGLIETQGFTAVFEAIDTACKAANVEVLGKEKLGGGYITIVLKGDVAAVKAAIDAGKSKVEGLGKLIAAHVIPRPSAAVLALLPKL